MIYKNPLFISSLLVLISSGLVIFNFAPQLIQSKNKNYFSQDFNNFCFNKVCINKENDSWYVLNNDKKVPADTEMVKIYSDKFKQIKLINLVSQNQNKFKELGIGVEPKTILEIGGKKLEIGNISSDSESTYVREDDKSEVYRIDSIFEKNNLSSAEYWYQRIILDLPKLQIKKINVKWQDHSKEFVQNNNVWENEEMINKITDLTRTNYLYDFKPDYNQSYQYDVEIDNGVKTFWIGQNTINRNKSIYWVTLDKIYAFEIDKSDFNALTASLN